MEFSAQQIAMLLGGKVTGDADRKVSDIGSIENAKEGQLTFLCDAKYINHLPTTNASVVLMTESIDFEGETNATIIRVENARAAMGQLLSLVAKAINPAKQGVEQPSFVSEGVVIPEDAYIGAFAYIGKNVQLGKGVQIYPHTYIGDNVKIGDNTIVYAGVKIYYNCAVGKDCILHAGAVIGADGFGFLPKPDGTFDKIPQLGNVIIEDNVEIGANTCVDRAKTDSTIIRKGVKLDNLIQIGHNVEIGENTVSSAQTGIAGTTKVGHNCFLAGQVGIADHLTIGNYVKIGSQSGLDKDVPDGEIRFGSPALPGINYHRSFAVFKTLPELQRRVAALEKAAKDKE
jgi:UDP-3-O-[3-hydroxymyristoyl] glucosamine N-acyltransferase